MTISLTDTATVTITITGLNDAPTAVDDTDATDQDTSITVPALTGVLSNDTDPEGDTLTVSELNGAATDVGVLVTVGYGAEVRMNADG